MKLPLKSGDEHDALTRAKRVHSFRAGTRKKIKKGYNKRVRRVVRKVLKQEEEQS